MRVKDSVWQGCFGYWQPLFIQENLLPLGHAAWQGFLSQGRGMVVCDLGSIDAPLVDWRRQAMPYTLHFMAEHQIPDHLTALDLDADFIARLLNVVQTYPPEQDMVLLLLENGEVDVRLLQRLVIPPPTCYRQVSDRWDEFALNAQTAEGQDDIV